MFHSDEFAGLTTSRGLPAGAALRESRASHYLLPLVRTRLGEISLVGISLSAARGETRGRRRKSLYKQTIAIVQRECHAFCWAEPPTTTDMDTHEIAWARPSTHAAVVSVGETVHRRADVLTAIFAATLFVSAALLFVVEPMFAKMVLPRLGGSPAVWNTCVVFFQATMLAGYAYADLTSRWLPLRQQIALHTALVVAAGLMLPVVVPADWRPPVEGTPLPALLMLLAASLGVPFFIVSSTAPLVQKWFSETDHTFARDPYFLYAASNLGSIVALVAYPFVVEPLLPLAAQSAAWTAAYAAFAALTLASAAGALRAGRPQHRGPTGAATHERTQEQLTWRRRFWWLTLAFIPSSLLLGVTTFLSTDIAAMPLLWTIPLALYLVTFVLAFASRRFIPPNIARAVAVVLTMTLVLAIILDVKEPAWLLMPLHLAGFLLCALALHTRLAADRPGTTHLTEFYLWVAAGGLAGGLFNTLVAPFLFSWVAEYPLVLSVALTLLVRSAKRASQRLTVWDWATPLALGVAVTALVLALKGGMLRAATGSAAIGLTGALLAACLKHPVRLALGLVLVVLGVGAFAHPGNLLHAERTFFGVLRVTADASGRHRLFHGSTLHGEQSLAPTRHREPLTYYHRTGPIGQTIQALSHRLHRVAVVGLGAGSLAAYAAPGQQWTFYEIDPAVERIARTPALFTYLQDCDERCDVVLGDARLSLQHRRVLYDLIVLDAFSSDAVPVHLITREALALYLSRLSMDGVIAFHISNRYLDLQPVIGALASEGGLQARVQLHSPVPPSEATTSLWVIAARTADAFGPLATDPRWRHMATGEVDAWSDDYSNILDVLGRPAPESARP